MNVIAPCKDCPDRSATCHAACEKYRAWKNRRERLIDKARKEKELDAVMAEMAKNWKK